MQVPNFYVVNHYVWIQMVEFILILTITNYTLLIIQLIKLNCPHRPIRKVLSRFDANETHIVLNVDIDNWSLCIGNSLVS